MPKGKSNAVAKRDSANGDASVVLQATFEYGSAGNRKTVTLNTQDLSKIKAGQIVFKLADPVDLGDLTEFLAWAGSTFKFTPPNPTTWPDPFSGLAKVDVTIDTLEVDQAKDTYALGVTMTPAGKPTIPIIDVAITEVGVAITKGAAG